MTADLNKIETIKNMIAHTTLLDEIQKRMWIDQVLPKASSDQLEKMEDIFKQEHAAYQERIKATQAKTDKIKEAINHIKSQKRASKEAAVCAAEEADMASLESELQQI